jgi:hypothetical protein
MGNTMEKGNWENRWTGNTMMDKWEDKQRKYCIIETKCKHSEGRYGRLQLGNVYTCNGFLQRMCEFEIVDSKKQFISLFNDLLTEKLATIYQ